MLDWFKVIQIKVNDDKFHYMYSVCRNKTISDEYVSVECNDIMASS